MDGVGRELMLDVDGIAADTQTDRETQRETDRQTDRQTADTPHPPAGSVWFLRQESLAQAVVLYTGDRTGQ
jgi:hypothetical protein